MHKGFLKTAAVLGILSVALGAFAAHQLRQMVADDAVAIFETGVRYQFYHVFALIAIGILYDGFRKKILQWAGIFFIAGIICFSGSLYMLTYVRAANIPSMKWVGPVTPLGGLFFIFGWLLLFVAIQKKRREASREGA